MPTSSDPTIVGVVVLTPVKGRVGRLLVAARAAAAAWAAARRARVAFEGVLATIAERAAQSVALLIVLVSRATAPFWVSNRPVMFAPVFAVTDVRARTVPTNVDPLPRVAELPTFQKTLHWLAPPVNSTRLADAVMRVDAA